MFAKGPAPSSTCSRTNSDGSSRRDSQRADDFLAGRRIPERDRDVSYPAFITDASDRAAFGAIQKLLLGPGEQLDQLAAIERMPRNEVHLAGEARELVPGADQLAVIATVDAIAQGFPELFGNRAAQLDREIRDAAGRIQLERRDDGLRRAHIDAGATRAAMLGLRLVDRQRQVGEDLARGRNTSRRAD